MGIEDAGRALRHSLYNGAAIISEILKEGDDWKKAALQHGKVLESEMCVYNGV
jgi:hypothetical protein